MKKISGVFAILLIIGCEVSVQDLIETSTMVDNRDNIEYKTIRIGNQTWMAENLAYFPYSSSLDSYENGIWVYGYTGTNLEAAKNDGNYSNVGCLYSWGVANSDQGNGVDICPQGWRMPTVNDWQELEDYVFTNSRTDLLFNGNEANGNAGLGFVATGYKKHKNFDGWGRIVRYWSSTRYENNANCFEINVNQSQSGDISYSNITTWAYYVRCIKD